MNSVFYFYVLFQEMPPQVIRNWRVTLSALCVLIMLYLQLCSARVDTLFVKVVDRNYQCVQPVEDL